MKVPDYVLSAAQRLLEPAPKRIQDSELVARWVLTLEAPPPKPATHNYPPGMGEESRRLHREYNALVEAQRQGVKNGAEVVRVTDECNAKGIILVPGGEHL